MKKITIAVLLLFSTFLISCKKTELPTGSANTTFEKLNLGDIYTKEFIEKFTDKETITKESLSVDASISSSDQYIILFDNGRVYSLVSKIFFPIDLTDSPAVSVNNQYVLVTRDETYEVYHYLKAQKLHTFDKAEATYNFYYGRIEEKKTVEGEEVITNYEFSNYKPVEPTVNPDENPLQEVIGLTIKDYTYVSNSTGITVFKNKVFYSHYFFEVGYDDHYFLENGNIVIQNIIELDANAADYTYIDSNVKYKLVHYLYDVASKKAKVIDLGIKIDFLQHKSEQFPINVDAMISFKTIDSQAKLIVPITRVGSLSNNLKLREVPLVAGEITDFTPLTENAFVAETSSGYFLFNAKNEIINNFSFNKMTYGDYLFRNETVLLYNRGSNSAFIYNLKNSELLHSGYEFVKVMTEHYAFLKKGDTYYLYDGTLKPLVGELSFHLSQNVYLLEGDETTKYYFYDGTLLFEASDTNAVHRRYYGEGEIIYIFSYTASGAQEHLVLRVKHISLS